MNNEAMEELKNRFPEIFALVELGRDGTPMFALVPDGVHSEILSIMCATIMGAAGTATAEVGGRQPETVVSLAGDTSILVVAVDSKRLLACAMKESKDTEPILQAMVDLVNQ